MYLAIEKKTKAAFILPTEFQDTKYFDCIPITDYIKKYDANDKTIKHVLIYRSGGIGDMVALSSIVNQIAQPVTIVMQKGYEDVIDLYNKSVNINLLGDPIFRLGYETKAKLKHYAYIDFTGALEFNGNFKKDWYENFFNHIGLDFKPEFGVPQIGFKSDNKNDKPTILICNEASSKIRTIEFETILKCFPDKIKENFIIKQAEKRNTLHQFFKDVYDCDFLISIDSGALHLREGFKKPGIGLFNCFPKDTRAKYYKYMSCFDIKSDCIFQPCFYSPSTPEGTCTQFKDKYCFCEKTNNNLISQLENIFNNYFEDIK